MERKSFSVDPTTREKETVSGYGFRNLFDGSTLFAVEWQLVLLFRSRRFCREQIPHYSVWKCWIPINRSPQRDGDKTMENSKRLDEKIHLE